MYWNWYIISACSGSFGFSGVGFVSVFGTGIGPYKVDFTADLGLNLRTKVVVTGNASLGSIDNFEFTYPSVTSNSLYLPIVTK